MLTENMFEYENMNIHARYGLLYLRSMQKMHGEVLERFLKGEHVERHRQGLWNGIWADMFTETTFMR